MDYKIALIPGDGIGPEIVREAKKVLDKASPRVSPSPKGISAPYSTAQPPAKPTPTAASRRAAGRSIARAAKGEGCKHRPSEDKTPIRSVIISPRFPAGSFVLFPALSGHPDAGLW